MTVTKLSLYNQALGILGDRELASLTEDRAARRKLDGAWDRGAVDHCLGQANFSFAVRSSMLDYDPSLTPDFGHQYAFEIPTDCVQLWSVCSDEFYTYPVERFANEGGYLFTDYETIYVKYASNGATFGGDYSKWTRQFQALVAAYLANEICASLTQSDNRAALARAALAKAEKEAKGFNAISSPSLSYPPSKLVLARRGGSGSWQ